MEKICRVFSATMESYPSMRDFVIDQAKACNVPQKRIMKLELGFEEAAVNIIHYAYEPQAPGKLWISIWQEPGKFFLELANGGKQFNPLERSTPQKQADISLEDVSIGGWGIYFIRKSFDQVSYRSDVLEGAPGNFLTMVIYD